MIKQGISFQESLSLSCVVEVGESFSGLLGGLPTNVYTFLCKMLTEKCSCTQIGICNLSIDRDRLLQRNGFQLKGKNKPRDDVSKRRVYLPSSWIACVIALIKSDYYINTIMMERRRRRHAFHEPSLSFLADAMYVCIPVAVGVESQASKLENNAGKNTQLTTSDLINLDVTMFLCLKLWGRHPWVPWEHEMMHTFFCIHFKGFFPVHVVRIRTKDTLIN